MTNEILQSAMLLFGPPAVTVALHFAAIGIIGLAVYIGYKSRALWPLPVLVLGFWVVPIVTSVILGFALIAAVCYIVPIVQTMREEK